MLLDISDLDPRGVGLDQVVEVKPFAWEGGDRVELDPVHIVGTLKPTRRGIELAAAFDAVAHLHCTRCLAAMDRPLEARFRLFVLPAPDTVRQGDEPQFDEIPEDDPDAVDLFPLEGAVLDLAVVLQEQVDLALPLRALCRDECRGLCSGCGADLNVESCRCEPLRDERFATLEQLKAALDLKQNERKKGEGP
jgi:uncharacterized protein